MYTHSIVDHVLNQLMGSDHVTKVTSSDAAVRLNFIIDCSLNESHAD